MGSSRNTNNSNTGFLASAALFLLFAVMGRQHALALGEESPEPVPLKMAQVDSRKLQAFRDAIAGEESSGGAYATQLPEQLLSLGLALQQEERHADAVAIFKRGAHLARINNGLYSAAQIRHIQNKITSHLALSEFDEADKSQAQLFRVQQRNPGNSELDVDALMQQARWQRQAYALGIGGNELSFGRLMNMWDLNRLALTSIMDTQGSKSPKLIPPLYGMLRAQYLISGHRPRTDHSRLNRYLSKSYDMGLSIIQAIYDIQAAQHGKESRVTIETRVMMGDWMLWHGASDSALDTYALALGELAELDDAQSQAGKLLEAPAALPDLEGVRQLPPEVSAGEAGFLVEFGVTRGGRIVDLVHLSKTEEGQKKTALSTQEKRLMRTLHKTRFRPRFVDGEATTTEKIVKAYAIAQ